MREKNEKTNGPQKENTEYGEEYLRLFPERTGNAHELTFLEKILLRCSSSKAAKFRCERNIVECINRYPLIKLMLGSLEKAGCAIDYRRHFSCEYCGPGVAGGYDPQSNQIVICYNKLTTAKRMESTLTHELVHMFDYCTTEFDGNNLEHVACAEIRAANLVHCSFLDAVFQRAASPFRIAKSQQECVKVRAIDSIHAGRPDMTREEVRAVIDRVFDRCYNDLEPMGRRVQPSMKDRKYAYREKCFYDFD